jgi:hypothetical protein
MLREGRRRGRLTPVWRAVIEIGFIVFLFYSNLLMGEFTAANGHGKTLTLALIDIFTVTNIEIALVSALIGSWSLSICARNCKTERTSRSFIVPALRTSSHPA